MRLRLELDWNDIEIGIGLRLRVYRLGVYNLGPSIFELETSYLGVCTLGVYSQGGLESRATDFGSGIASIWESTLWESTVWGAMNTFRLK